MEKEEIWRGRMIKTYPSAILREKSEDVDISNLEAYKELIESMEKVIMDFEALGLAAVQIGQPVRIIGIKPSGAKKPKFMINPRIVHRGGMMIGPEACLSFPNVLVTIRRNSYINVSYYDLEGNEQSEEVMGQEAIIIQHEIDHLDGVTLYQRAPRAERNRLMRKLAVGRRKLAKYLKFQNHKKQLNEELEKFDEKAGEFIFAEGTEAEKIRIEAKKEENSL